MTVWTADHPRVGRHNQPQVVESLPDGGNMWIVWEHNFNTMTAMPGYACSWDSAMTIADDPNTPVPFVDQWYPTAAAARMAWEINKPKRPALKFRTGQRFGVGFVDPKGIFGSKA